MANSPFTVISDYRDIEALRFYAEATERGDDLAVLLLAMAKMSRDQARTPVQWDASPGAGFTAGTPWLAINPDHVTVNAAAEVDDPDSVLRPLPPPDRPAPRGPASHRGDFELLLPDHPTIWAFLRRAALPAGNVELLVVANFSAGPVSVSLPLGGGWADARVVVSSHYSRAAAAAARSDPPPLGIRRLAPRLVLTGSAPSAERAAPS